MMKKHIHAIFFFWTLFLDNGCENIYKMLSMTNEPKNIKKDSAKKEYSMRYGTIVLIVWFFPISVWGMIASNVANLSQQGTDGHAFVFSLGVSTEVESGDMTYTIQGEQDESWKSELAWPLEGIVYLGGVVSVRFLERFQVNTGLWKNVNVAEGTMKDSDWFYERYGDEKAIYSETDSPVEATHVDLNVRYDLFKLGGIAVGPMIGYAYTKWNWEAGNGYQTSIDPIRFYVGSLPAKSISYEQKITVPYVGLALSFYPNDSPFGFNGFLL